ncbi:MAG: hypothetical protein WA324_30480 [Bryobacteraceae bacterium]
MHATTVRCLARIVYTSEFLSRLVHAAVPFALLRLPFGTRSVTPASIAILIALLGPQAVRSQTLSIKLRAIIDNDAILVTWSNQAKTALVNIGSLFGWAGVSPRVTFRFVMGGSQGSLIDTNGPGVIGGRATYLIVCLPTGGEYGLRFDMHKLWLPGYKTRLIDVKQQWKVRAVFTGVYPKPELPNNKMQEFQVLRDYPVNFPFWTGQVQAEVVGPAGHRN